MYGDLLLKAEACRGAEVLRELFASGARARSLAADDLADFIRSWRGGAQ